MTLLPTVRPTARPLKLEKKIARGMLQPRAIFLDVPLIALPESLGPESLRTRDLSGPDHGYGKYLHRSLSSLKPEPFDPEASKPSPPNIQNSCSPVCAGVVVQ
jgi:hypothetical protein